LEPLTADKSDNRYFADFLLKAMCRMCAPSGTLLGRAHWKGWRRLNRAWRRSHFGRGHFPIL